MFHFRGNNGGVVDLTQSDDESVDGQVDAEQEIAVLGNRRKISGIIDGRPRPQAQRIYIKGKGGKKGRYVDPSAQHKRKVRKQLRDNRVADGDHTGPLSGPVGLMVTFWFRASQASQCGQPHTKRPDIDNLQKLLFDAMNQAGFFEDDCKVATVSISKRYCLELGTEGHTTYYVYERLV